MNKLAIDKNGVRVAALDDDPTIPGLATLTAAGMLKLILFGLDDLPDEGVEATIGMLMNMVGDLFTAADQDMAEAFGEALRTGDDSALLRFLPIKDGEEEQCGDSLGVSKGGLGWNI